MSPIEPDNETYSIRAEPLFKDAGEFEWQLPLTIFQLNQLMVRCSNLTSRRRDESTDFTPAKLRFEGRDGFHLSLNLS